MDLSVIFYYFNAFILYGVYSALAKLCFDNFFKWGNFLQKPNFAVNEISLISYLYYSFIISSEPNYIGRTKHVR